MRSMINRVISIYFTENPFKNGFLFLFINLLLSAVLILAMTGYYSLIILLGNERGEIVEFILTTVLPLLVLSITFLSIMRLWFRVGEEIAQRHNTIDAMLISIIASIPFGFLFTLIDTGSLPYLFSIWIIIFGFIGMFATLSKEIYHVSVAMLILILVLGILSASNFIFDTSSNFGNQPYIFSLLQSSSSADSLSMVLSLEGLKLIPEQSSLAHLLISYLTMIGLISTLSLGSHKLFFKHSPFTITEDFVASMKEEEREK